MPNKRISAPDDDISWRTRELGPEMRRKLFEKVLPSGKVLPSASPGASREGPAPSVKDSKPSERPKGPKQSRK